MIKLGDRAGLAIEPLTELRIGCERLRQDFDRDGAIEARVAGTIDLTHPAGAEWRHNFVRTESSA
jgi:hypothetical protein